jgi:hypothetical protein
MHPQQPTVQHSVVHPKPPGKAKHPGARQRVPIVQKGTANKPRKSK